MSGSRQRPATARFAAAVAMVLAGMALLCLPCAPPLRAAEAARHVDARLRDVLYDVNEIYRLPGYVGYAIDIEFEPGERFVGLGSGDVEGLAFAAQSNHLFIKPKARHVRTDLTVLTTRRIYHFDYTTLPHAPQADGADVVYALRFLYPRPPPPAAAAATTNRHRAIATLLAGASDSRPHNRDYWYCGSKQLRPVGAWDDGVQTHLLFDRQAELPALFVLNDDGSEALVDFHVRQTEIVVHRVARRFLLRRGRLTGCVVNRSFSGAGAALPSGTLSPQVLRLVGEPQQ